MATLFNEIFSAIRGRCISDESASVAAAEVAELVVKKFTSTKPSQAKCLCNTCQNVGCRGVEIPFRGKWTMHECEGYSAPEPFEREEV